MLTCLCQPQLPASLQTWLVLADWRAGVLTTYALLLLLLLCCREEREQRRADIEHLAGSLVNKVNECVAAIDEGACTASQNEITCIRGHMSCSCVSMAAPSACSAVKIPPAAGWGAHVCVPLLC